MKTNFKILAAVVLTNIAIFMGCEEKKANTNSASLKLSFSSLPTLTGTSKYVLWLVANGKNTPVYPPFSSAATGEVTFNTDATVLSAATSALITIEKSDTVTNPSSTQFLSGKFDGKKLVMTITDALGNDLSTISGVYYNEVRTGTSTVATAGLWFYNKDAAGKETAGLNLPKITGWKYEAWVKTSKTEAKYLSLGKFTSVNTSDDASNYNGESTKPSFPGEDFLNNQPTGYTFPLDLKGLDIFITLEPTNDPDNAAPFAFEILTGTIGQRGGKGELGKGKNVFNNQIEASGTRP